MRLLSYLIPIALSVTSSYGQDVQDFMDLASNFMQQAGKENLGNMGNLGNIVEGLGGAEGLGALASAFLNRKDDSASDPRWEILSQLAPLLLNQGHEHSDDPNHEDTHSHKAFEDATAMLMPILMRGWDSIKSSEVVSELLQNSGLQTLLDTFQSPHGPILLDNALRSLENPSFRKKWLRSMVSFVAEYVKHITNPETQKRYMVNAALAVNSILKSIGYTDKELLAPGPRFADSVVLVANNVAKKQFGVKVNSAMYIMPIFDYLNELVQFGSKGVSSLTQRQIEDKIAETLNQEVVETILRVYRAHKHAVKKHKCDRYLLCELNRHAADKKYVVRPIITKGASLVSAWFLSGQTGTSFWKLYSAATEDYKCEVQFPSDCAEFHEEDIKKTTEYYEHNEL
ncbi:hypothetical protein GE061_014877 [Apolygus lucorum]|uniref:Uncharacterized protein n=1 Tax=Apolygus lucorum TaxID=248454 RepID=A0A6A4JJI7_APOLU|nr:hypothetical protein GE061_014877 [Apolygus lucorum]